MKKQFFLLTLLLMFTSSLAYTNLIREQPSLSLPVFDDIFGTIAFCSVFPFILLFPVLVTGIAYAPYQLFSLLIPVVFVFFGLTYYRLYRRGSATEGEAKTVYSRVNAFLTYGLHFFRFLMLAIVIGYVVYFAVDRLTPPRTVASYIRNVALEPLDRKNYILDGKELQAFCDAMGIGNTMGDIKTCLDKNRFGYHDRYSEGDIVNAVGRTITREGKEYSLEQGWYYGRFLYYRFLIPLPVYPARYFVLFYKADDDSCLLVLARRAIA